MTLPIIVSDLDGCLVNLMDGLLEFIWNRWHVALRPEDCVDYDIAASFAKEIGPRLSIAELASITDPSASNRDLLNTVLTELVWSREWLYEDARPYWDTHQAFQSLLAGGGRVCFMTGRPPTSEMQTVTADWLSRWGYRGLPLLFAQERCGGKLGLVLDVLQECIVDARSDTQTPRKPLSPIWVLEDDLAVAQQIVEAVGPHITMFSPRRPWTDISCWKRDLPAATQLELKAHHRELYRDASKEADYAG